MAEAGKAEKEDSSLSVPSEPLNRTAGIPPTVVLKGTPAVTRKSPLAAVTLLLSVALLFHTAGLADVS